MKMLTFNFGTMNSAKTANLLMKKYEYEEQGYSVLLIKPIIDNRDGIDIVKSRIGLSSKCKPIEKNENLKNINWYNYDILMVDEAQFLTKEQVEQLHELSLKIDIDCYGLLSDFKKEPFEGSLSLFVLADKRNNIDKICSCGNPANFNARFTENGTFVEDGDQVQIGGNEQYKAVCKHCYEKLQRYKTINCLDKYF